MDQVAHIRYEGGALLLPAQNPYDREIVFEEAKFCARRYGIASMQLGWQFGTRNRRKWSKQTTTDLSYMPR